LQPSDHQTILDMAVNGPQLPGELINIIINHLLPDRRAIKICSLVCRAWLPWTRVHLFSSVQLVVNIRTVAGYKDQVIPFLSLLKSPYCTFPYYVRSIHMDWRRAKFPVQHSTSPLDVLHNRHPWLNHNNNRDKKDSFLRKVKTSLAKSVDRDSSRYVMNVIRLFPAVEHLQISLWGLVPDIAECHELPPISPNLTSLALECLTFDHMSPGLPQEWENLMGWVHRERIYNIRRLYIKGLSNRSMEGLQTLLKVQGNSLRHLSLRLSNFCPPISFESY
jgi:hypothetical protein